MLRRPRYSRPTAGWRQYGSGSARKSVRSMSEYSGNPHVTARSSCAQYEAKCSSAAGRAHVRCRFGPFAICIRFAGHITCTAGYQCDEGQGHHLVSRVAHGTSAVDEVLPICGQPYFCHRFRAVDIKACHRARLEAQRRTRHGFAETMDITDCSIGTAGTPNRSADLCGNLALAASCPRGPPAAMG